MTASFRLHSCRVIFRAAGDRFYRAELLAERAAGADGSVDLRFFAVAVEDDRRTSEFTDAFPASDTLVGIHMGPALGLCYRYAGRSEYDSFTVSTLSA